MSNRLANESSPYLLQHQNNPVDWYPWSEEALARSRAEDKPIFLSIGYSACHWCHVMEHESFENKTIADYLNQHFVSIKVDREERPDLDQIYMDAVQLMTGRGGWPMSVFLTPEGKPFFGGTYWPPSDRQGMPGFDRVLRAIIDAWTNRRDQALEQATQLTDHLSSLATADNTAAMPTSLTRVMVDGWMATAANRLARSFDSRYGGFGGAPKFPHSMDLELLLLEWHRTDRADLAQMSLFTLDRMASGGIYDHLGGGFARYSVDERWLVPHFEKMLYDNSLLLRSLVRAYQASGDEMFAEVMRHTCDYLLRDMTDGLGGIYSTEDADSEGVEGKFYVWKPAEIIAILGKERGERFCQVYDVAAAGNFEHGESILNLRRSISEWAKLWEVPLEVLQAELAVDRAQLFDVREGRIHPGKDDKIITSWNALAIDALAEVAGVLDEPRYLVAAQRAADFILTELRGTDGRLLHTWRHGVARLPAYLDDYAYLIHALAALYEADFQDRWVVAAVQLADVMVARFSDYQQGGFFFTADDHEQLITRKKDLHDGSVPSGSSMAALALARLGKLTGRQDYLAAAERTILAASGAIEANPTAASVMVQAADLLIGPSMEIVIAGTAEQIAATASQLRRAYIPRKVVAAVLSEQTLAADSPLAPLVQGKPVASDVSLYVCHHFSCRAPMVGELAVSDTIETLSTRLAATSGE